MNNKAHFSLVILSAVLLSACNAKAPLGVDTQAGGGNKPAETESEQSISTSMRDLLAMGKSQKCSVSTSSIDDKNVKTSTEATVYISGTKIAEDIKVTSTDKDFPVINMRMISDGTYMYTWNTDTKSQAMKMKITEPTGDKEGKAESGKVQKGSVDMDQKVDMKCSSWNADNSKFTVPSDIQFTDLSEMMKNIPTMPANIRTGE